MVCDREDPRIWGSGDLSGSMQHLEQRKGSLVRVGDLLLRAAGKEGVAKRLIR